MKIGDRVAVLDDDLEGTVKHIKDDTVIFEDENGFDMQFSKNELVVMSSTKLLYKNSKAEISQVINEKESIKSKSSTRIKPKERSAPAMEVDLHLHKLVPSEKGLNAYEKLNIQLDEAQHKIEFAIKKRIQKIVFIHGVGEGVLKAELETLLRRYDNLKFYDADFKKYGFGATEVYFFQNY